MRSPALAARERTQARLAAASSPFGVPVVGDAHNLMLAQLVEHRRALKDIQSVERKIEAKRLFLPIYDAWVDATLAHGKGGQDPIITTVLIWHIDAGNYARALQIARYAVQHSLELPDQYERSLAVALIDEFGAAYLTGKMTPDQALQILADVLQLTSEHDAPDQARAKLHKAIGYALIGKTGPGDVELDKVAPAIAAQALQHCRRALELFEQVGTKKDIERLERRLKNAGEPSAVPVRTPEPGGSG